MALQAFGRPLCPEPQRPSWLSYVKLDSVGFSWVQTVSVAQPCTHRGSGADDGRLVILIPASRRISMGSFEI